MVRFEQCNDCGETFEVDTMSNQTECDECLKKNTGIRQEEKIW